MNTINEYGNIKNANKALYAISKGGKFNGVVYGKKHNDLKTDMTVYVSGDIYPLGRISHKFVEDFKAEFLAAVNNTEVVTSQKTNISKPTTKAIDEKKQYSTMAWLMDGMNYE
jgi:hypothetical protein